MRVNDSFSTARILAEHQSFISVFKDTFAGQKFRKDLLQYSGPQPPLTTGGAVCD